MGREKGQFKKGVSGNPGGCPKKDPLIREFQETKYKDFIDKLQRFGDCTLAELKSFIDDPETKIFDRIFIRILYDAQQGKADARQVLLERLWGKVKDQLEHSGHIDLEREKLQKLSTAELIGIIKDFFGNKDENQK